MASHDFYDAAELSKRVVVNDTATTIHLITKDGNTLLNSFPPRGPGDLPDYETTTLAGLPVRGNQKTHNLPLYTPGQVTIVSLVGAGRIQQRVWKYPGIILMPDITAEVTYDKHPTKIIRGFHRFQVIQSDIPDTGDFVVVVKGEAKEV